MVYTLCRTLLSHKNRMKLVLCNWKPLYIKNPVSNRQVTVFKNVIYPNMTDILESDHCFLPFFILRIIRLFFFPTCSVLLSLPKGVLFLCFWKCNETKPLKNRRWWRGQEIRQDNERLRNADYRKNMLRIISVSKSIMKYVQFFSLYIDKLE